MEDVEIVKRKHSVYAKTTSGAMGRQAFIETKVEVGRSFGEDGGTGMSEALVPDGGSDGGGEAVAWRRQRIEVAVGVTSEKHLIGG